MATFSCFQESTIKVEDGVIRNAKLLGLTSRNGRRYESKALKNAVTKYEGKKVYVDHPEPGTRGERKFNDWAGVIQNARYSKDGIYGDVVLRKESSHFAGIVEAASDERFSKSCGFSHVAEGESHLDGETEIIESIKEVFSVDLVTDPATTAGFYESVNRAQVLSVNEAVEALPESDQRTKLVEMLGDFSFGEMPAEEGKPTDALGEIATMCRELIRMLGEALVAKSTPPPPAIPAPGTDPAAKEADPTKEAEEQPEEDMTDEDKQKIEAFESLQRENAELKAKTLLIESGREPSAPRMKALANCETDEEREELLESWPTIEQVERPTSSPGLIESNEDFPRDPKKFAALLR